MARILITDDSAFQRTIISSLLRSEGHEVIQAASGEEGLRMVGTENPDAVILDILMPDLSGIEVLATIRKAHPTLPVIMSTADIQKTTRDECFSQGATAFITKPVNRADLAAALAEALSQGHAR